MNAKTAEVIWTTDLSVTPVKSLWYPSAAFVDENNVAIKTNAKFLILDKASGAYKLEIDAR